MGLPWIKCCRNHIAVRDKMFVCKLSYSCITFFITDEQENACSMFTQDAVSQKENKI